MAVAAAVHATVRAITPPTWTVPERLPAGGTRGSWPAEEYAVARRAQGTDARVVRAGSL